MIGVCGVDEGVIGVCGVIGVPGSLLFSQSSDSRLGGGGGGACLLRCTFVKPDKQYEIRQD